MKSRANAFQSEHGGGFTIEIYCGIPGYSAVNRGGGRRRGKHVSRHPKYGVDRSRIPLGDANFLDVGVGNGAKEGRIVEDGRWLL